MTVGDRIKLVRESKGMTQEDLAFACGYKSRSTINKFEKGICETKLSNIKKIASALGVDTDYLVFGDSDEKKEEIERLFNQLTDNQQDAVLAFLRSMTAGRE